MFSNLQEVTPTVALVAIYLQAKGIMLNFISNLKLFSTFQATYLTKYEKREFIIIFTSVLISEAEKLDLLIILLSLSFSHSLLTPAACHILAKGSTVKIRVANGAPITIRRKEAHRRRRLKGNSTVLSPFPEQTKVEQHLPRLLAQLICSRGVQ